MSKQSFYNSRQNVLEYIKMCEGYDGSDLINKLANHLNPGATVLELGMGPGSDLDILKKKYKVTGSDNSQVFLDLYKEKHPQTQLMLLDAISINTNQKFDCIYSNKVLHHLERGDLDKSLIRQAEVLNESCLVFHTFWKGEGEEVLQEMQFTYYTIDQLARSFKPYFKILDCEVYKEMEVDDSICIVAKKR